LGEVVLLQELPRVLFLDADAVLVEAVLGLM